jgi:hypothetical protein
MDRPGPGSDAVITEDVIVYAHRDGYHYVARFDELGWVTWPATQDGWAKRKSGRESDVDTSRELDTKHGALALRLSGVTP